MKVHYPFRFRCHWSDLYMIWELIITHTWVHNWLPLLILFWMSGQQAIKAGLTYAHNQHCVHSHLLNTTTMSSPSYTDDVKRWVVVRPTTFAYHLCLCTGTWNSKFCKRLNNLVDLPDILKSRIFRTYHHSRLISFLSSPLSSNNE